MAQHTQKVSTEWLEDNGYRLITQTGYIWMDINYNTYSTLTYLHKDDVRNSSKQTINYYHDTVNKKVSSITVAKAHMHCFPESYGVPIEYKDYSGYLVTKEGNIYSLAKGKEIFPTLRKDGTSYPSIKMKNSNGDMRSVNIHLIMANTFIPKPDSDKRLEVNHKNLDKNDWKVSNLEWVTREENVKHAYATGAYDDKLKIFEVFDSNLNKIDTVKGRHNVQDIVGKEYATDLIERHGAHNLTTPSIDNIIKTGDYYIRTVPSNIF